MYLPDFYVGAGFAEMVAGGSRGTKEVSGKTQEKKLGKPKNKFRV